jgi:hypothetical protein
MFSVLSFGANFYIGKVGYGKKHIDYTTSTNVTSNWALAITPAEQKQLEESVDLDGDGVPDRLDKCPVLLLVLKLMLQVVRWILMVMVS